MSPDEYELATMKTLQDDAIMAGASGTQTVAAAAGRTLAIAEWGDPDGFPVFSLHGTPGSRFARHYGESAYAEVGSRTIPANWSARARWSSPTLTVPSWRASGGTR